MKAVIQLAESKNSRKPVNGIETPATAATWLRAVLEADPIDAECKDDREDQLHDRRVQRQVVEGRCDQVDQELRWIEKACFLDRVVARHPVLGDEHREVSFSQTAAEHDPQRRVLGLGVVGVEVTSIREHHGQITGDDTDRRDGAPPLVHVCPGESASFHHEFQTLTGQVGRTETRARHAPPASEVKTSLRVKVRDGVGPIVPVSRRQSSPLKGVEASALDFRRSARLSGRKDDHGARRGVGRLGTPSATPGGAQFSVDEIVLVHDNGPDRSDVVLLELERRFEQVRVVWLSRNYGQDAATIAGMAAATGQWIVTMDEDGQHDPVHIGAFLDTALTERSDLVYSKPTNTRPHGFLRNLTSRGAKIVLATVFAFPDSTRFESYRLIRGDIGRQLAGVAANGVYLDVALTWVVGNTATAPVALRAEGREESGYNYRRLFSLFWKMVLCSGTRGLRLVSLLGVTLASAGVIMPR